MFGFSNYGLALMFGIMVIAAIILVATEKKKKKSYWFLILTIIMFLLVLIGLPYMEYQRALQNIKTFQNEKLLQCYSSSGLFGTSESYMVAKDQWDQKDFNFVKKDNRLVIRANHCE